MKNQMKSLFELTFKDEHKGLSIWVTGGRSRAQEPEGGGCGAGPGRCSCLAEQKPRESPMRLAGKGQKWPPSSEPYLSQALKLGQELWPPGWAGGLQLVG